MNKVVGGLPYYGGKNPKGQTCKWIVRVLGPVNNPTTYCEPFAGMLGVLLARPPSKVEIASDANGYVLSWWLAVRDYPEEFDYKIKHTPHSRTLFEEYCKKARQPCSGNVLEDALVAHTVITQGIIAGIGKTGWASRYDSGVTTGTKLRESYDIELLSQRLRHVQLENKDACWILDRLKNVENLTVYCDPPYQNADVSPYGKNDIDLGKIAELLKVQKGRVAISGYKDEWDDLGWNKVTYQALCRAHTAAWGTKAQYREEVLWCNFEPAKSVDLENCS